MSAGIAVKCTCVSEYHRLVPDPDGYVRFVVEVKVVTGDYVESILGNEVERARNAWQRDSLGRFKYSCAIALKYIQGTRLDIDSSTLRNHQLRAPVIPQICSDHCYGDTRNWNRGGSSFRNSAACDEGAIAPAKIYVNPVRCLVSDCQVLVGVAVEASRSNGDRKIS